jgi:hypothetical protein
VDILLISDNFKGNPVERLKLLSIPAGFSGYPLNPKRVPESHEKRELPRN